MPRFLSFLFFLLTFPITAFSSKLIQVDVLIYTPLMQAKSWYDPPANPVEEPNFSQAVRLNTAGLNQHTPYTFLSTQKSHLLSDYYQLRKNPHYQIVLNQSWLIPIEKAKSVMIEKTMVKIGLCVGQLLLNIIPFIYSNLCCILMIPLKHFIHSK